MDIPNQNPWLYPPDNLNEPSVKGNKVIFCNPNLWTMVGRLELRGNTKIFYNDNGFIYKEEMFNPINCEIVSV